jgi:hypothetical protein
VDTDAAPQPPTFHTRNRWAQHKTLQTDEKIKIMKKVILSIVLFYIVSIAHGQFSWAPIGAEWHFNHQEMFLFQAHGYIKYKVIKDSIINNHQVKLIIKQEVKFDGKQMTSDTLYAYEENSKVYYYVNGNFIMFYDFNVEIGDTVVLSNEIINCDSITPIIVKEKDSLKINNVDLITIKLGYTSLKYNYDRQERIISYNSKLSIDLYYPSCAYPIGMQVDDFSPPDYLRCYHDSSVMYEDDYWVKRYPNAKCDTLIDDRVNINSINNSSQTSIYPNPTNDLIYIESKDIFVSLKVYNIQGTEQMYIQEYNIKKIELGKLKNGIYILELNNINGIKYYYKALKNYCSK